MASRGRIDTIKTAPSTSGCRRVAKSKAAESRLGLAFFAASAGAGCACKRGHHEASAKCPHAAWKIEHGPMPQCQ